jgi:hypothetical protein
MSLAKVKKAVEEFLSTDSPEVLSIKGGWGVGKTFFWNLFIKSASQDPKYKFERYAYVSLFGISSLDELKFTIFGQSIKKSQVGASISIDNLKQNANDLAEHLSIKTIHGFLSFLLRIPFFRNYGSELIQPASFLLVKDMLICLDDFERKGNQLSAKDILGLVSLLKEQRNCKVILIFNDSKIEGIDQEDYKKFREKVIDVEVIFNPYAKEATSLVFPDNSGIHKQIRDFSIELGINNIRILKKIERAAKSVEKLLRNFESEVLQQAFKTLTLLGWTYYSNNEPFYEYIKSRHAMYMIKKDKTPQEEGWDALLSDYEFGYIDEFDLALANVIETGYIDEGSFLEGAQKVNAQIIVRKSQNSFNNAWDLFFNTFADNEDELVSALEKGLKENAEYISPNNLNSTVHLLRDLGKGHLASELIDAYIEKNKTKPKLFDLDNYSFFKDIDDDELISKFKLSFNKTKETKTLDDIVRGIAERNGWGGADEEVLFAASENDFYQIFKRYEGNLKSYVNACLRFGRLSPATDQQKAIAEKARDALIRIGRENNLNRIRVRRLGISIEDSDTSL